MSLPPFVARLIGIGKYSEYPHLHPEGDINAENLGDFLKDKFFDAKDSHDIQVMKDANKDDIVKIFTDLRNTLDRNKGFLFFFSGIGGRTVDGPSIICPADIGQDPKKQGITNQELAQLFDNISRFRGNNITFLLDSPSSAFQWGNPSSFVVIAPRNIQRDNRRAFTRSVIDVLHSEKFSLASLTVQSFAAKVHAVMPRGIEIDCYGQNVDRLLFNPKGGKAHYAFIPGRAETDGSLTLFAGSAHGVAEGSTYAIYQNHIDPTQVPFGHLQVTRVKNSTTSALCVPPPNLTVPPVFYAVETYCPHETVDIYQAPNDVDSEVIKPPGWKEAGKDTANVTLERVEGGVNIFWNGFTGYRTRLEIGRDIPEAELAKVIRHASRFAYHVGSSNSLSPLFEVEFQQIDEDLEEPTGKDLINGGLVDLKITKENTDRMFCIVLQSKAKTDIWPFVFLCDPSRLTIQPWYTPKEPLAPEKKLIVGGSDGDNFMFEWRRQTSVALTYIKIFATKERTSFSFLTQDRSNIEDKFREVGQVEAATADGNPEGTQSPSSATQPSRSRTSEKGDWNTMQITVQQTYEAEKPSISAPEKLNFYDFLRKHRAARLQKDLQK